MAVVGSMSNDNGQDMHPFFMSKASEFPSYQSRLIPKLMSGADFKQRPDTLQRQALI